MQQADDFLHARDDRQLFGCDIVYAFAAQQPGQVGAQLAPVLAHLVKHINLLAPQFIAQLGWQRAKRVVECIGQAMRHVGADHQRAVA